MNQCEVLQRQEIGKMLNLGYNISQAAQETRSSRGLIRKVQPQIHNGDNVFVYQNKLGAPVKIADDVKDAVIKLATSGKKCGIFQTGSIIKQDPRFPNISTSSVASILHDKHFYYLPPKEMISFCEEQNEDQGQLAQHQPEEGADEKKDISKDQSKNVSGENKRRLSRKRGEVKQTTQNNQNSPQKTSVNDEEEEEEKEEEEEEEKEEEKEETKGQEEVPTDLLKIVSFNAASLNAAWGKGFSDYLKVESPDIICIQETQLNEPKLFSRYIVDGYYSYFYNCEAKKGYAGTAIFTKYQPISVKPAFQDNEGRVILMEFSNFYLINSYVPNAKMDLSRLDDKVNNWNPKLGDLMDELCKTKPAILCGDLNVAHNPIDIFNTKGKEKVPGYTPKERKWFDDFLKKGYIDVFRYLYPEKQQFSFFSYRFNAKAKGNGWRLDYFVMPKKAVEAKMVADCYITSHDFSDHSPVVLLLDKGKAISNADALVDKYGITIINNGKIITRESENIPAPKTQRKTKKSNSLINSEKQPDSVSQNFDLHRNDESQDMKESILAFGDVKEVKKLLKQKNTNNGKNKKSERNKRNVDDDDENNNDDDNCENEDNVDNDENDDNKGSNKKNEGNQKAGKIKKAVGKKTQPKKGNPKKSSNRKK